MNPETKLCKRCKKDKPLTEFKYYKRSGTYTSNCLPCIEYINKRHYRKYVQENDHLLRDFITHPILGFRLD